MKTIRVGQKYGLLTVLKKLPSIKRSTKWLCLCDCGNLSEPWGSGLTSTTEPTKSCGCLQTASARKVPGYSGYSTIFAAYKARAKKKQIDFNLTREQFVSLISKNCHYSGTPPRKINPYLRADGKLIPGRKVETAERAWVYANGIDRIDSNKGYTLENVVPCCAKCNYFKLDYSETEFIEHCRLVTEFQEAKNAK